MCKLNVIQQAKKYILRLRLLLLIKAMAVFFLFLPQWGFLWHKPAVIDQEAFSADMPWVFENLKWYWFFGWHAATVIYLAICLLSVISVIIISFIRSHWLRLPMALFLMAGCAFEFTILDIRQTFSSREMLITFWREFALASDAFNYYQKEIYRNAIYAVALLPIFLLAPSRSFSLSKRWALVPMLAIALATAKIIHTQGVTTTFPIPVGLAANVAAIRVASEESEILRSEMPVPVSKSIDRIIMIMDESVRGDYMSLNNSPFDDTPKLKADPSVINFGVAVSGANCSIFSRVIFRFGMREAEVPFWREAMNNPTIWDFAKRAGYRTVFITAWFGPFQNGFSPVEALKVDQNLFVGVKPAHLRDDEIVHVIKQTLDQNSEGKLFLYVDKYGVHVPYDDKYPADRKIFSPLGNTERDIERSQYANAVSWSVDSFFDKLKSAVSLDRTLLIYTSDHGQSLREGDYSLSHCSNQGKIVLGEGYVPLLVKTNDKDYEKRLRLAATEGKNHFSHYEVFPTLLLAMGFPDLWVKSKYGDSLFALPPSNKKRVFYAGNSPRDAKLVYVDK